MGIRARIRQPAYDPLIAGMFEPEPAGAGAVRFNQFDLMIQAALDGQGVALGRSPLVDRLIDQGKLVAPFHDKHYSTSRAYFIVRSAAVAKRPQAQAVVAWLAAEARESDVGEKPVAKRSRKAKR